MKLSVIVPAFNEERTLERILRRVLDVPCDKEILVVDDCSTDATPEILRKLVAEHPDTVRAWFHAENQGKGAAIRTALPEVRGEIIVIQDADLEYHPEDYPAGLRLIEQGWADAVYGSRFLGPHRVFLYWHYLGNRFLTWLANVITSGILTDMETGYKMIRADVFRALDVQSFTFDFEVEVTIKLFRNGFRVYEVPITYTGRDYDEGKKITWRDGVRALRALARWGWRVPRAPRPPLPRTGRA